MRVSISTPYRANSIVHIARAAAASAHLQRFYTTLYLARWRSAAQRLPVLGPRLAQELDRRAFPGIPVEWVVNVATFPELVHVGTRRLMGDHKPALVAGLMYRVKAQFDIAVAGRLHRECPNVLVGMYGASLESFRAIQRQGGLAVLNFVNSHPAEHNRHLNELVGMKAPHHELIPEWVSQRVEAELAVADLVLAPSRFVAEQLRGHGVAAEKIATLPYGVDLRAFHPEKQRRGSESGPLTCLYVGQISHRKGIRTLLEAAQRCRDMPVRFRLIGPIVTADVLEGLPDNVVYEGPSLPGGVAQAMRNADFFVLPTIEDSFALVLFEAMATGLAVVTTTHAGASELIEDGRDGLIVPPGNAAALADAIRRLAEQPELRARLGEAACIKVQAAHSWESYGQSVLTAIQSRLEGERTSTVHQSAAR